MNKLELRNELVYDMEKFTTMGGTIKLEKPQRNKKITLSSKASKRVYMSGIIPKRTKSKYDMVME